MRPGLRACLLSRFCTDTRGGIILNQGLPAGWYRRADLINIWIDSHEPAAVLLQREVALALFLTGPLSFQPQDGPESVIPPVLFNISSPGFHSCHIWD